MMSFSPCIKMTTRLAYCIALMGCALVMASCAPTTQAAPTTPPTPTAAAPTVTIAAPAEPQPQLEPAPAPVATLVARIDTPRGSFSINLRTAEAPMTCANFVNLVQRGAYENSAFHDWTRVLRQSGGPSKTFDPGYSLRREFSAKLMFDGPGMVAMQKHSDGEHAHATQFFVTVKEQSRWNLDIPIFATVIAGQEIVDALLPNDTITHIEIEGNPAPLLKRFAPHISQWNRMLDAAITKDGLPPLKVVPVQLLKVVQ